MSSEGKLRRGKAYYERRDKEGNYPREITENSSMKSDLDFYLNSIKPKPQEKKTKEK